MNKLKVFVFSMEDDTSYNEGVEYWFRPNIYEIVDVIYDYWSEDFAGSLELATIGEKKRDFYINLDHYYDICIKNQNKQYPELDLEHLIETILSNTTNNSEDSEGKWIKKTYDWPKGKTNEIHICKLCDVFYVDELKCKYCNESNVFCDDKV